MQVVLDGNMPYPAMLGSCGSQLVTESVMLRLRRGDVRGVVEAESLP